MTADLPKHPQRPQESKHSAPLRANALLFSFGARKRPLAGLGRASSPTTPLDLGLTAYPPAVLADYVPSEDQWS